VRHLHFTALEVMESLDLSIAPDRILVHLNTFHRKEDLDDLLRTAAGRGVRYLLVVSGDGGPRLPKLEPEDLEVSSKAVTSVELPGYIRSRFPGAFMCGVAFNQYEPPAHEIEKLERKIAAGAEFVVTQPVIGVDAEVARLLDRRIPIFVEAWMSRRIELVYECVGVAAPPGGAGAP
jgi:methylenetetrahydrofolate reductase (NADPH)